ncbi:glutamine amidotransferase-like class 1 domain-containing protein 3A, mitochondrial isoform X2 [Panthera tigris]|uniref:glutamine amidotransferase-like class 1 domain-containing protein 3A, mitochondrial isoform X2 n=1 Tax=Panthera tigris TaxID=9694 RepID=UPI001C6FC5CF|nr:glutamine amidotransferase-like class 1 domain-containing protein 3A, mitochondrial isoform X2 [Panthera tigris]
MAAVRALVAPRLAAASAFAPLHAPAPRAALHSSAPRPRARVALVLSGCGVYDGTELHEASAVLVHLSRGGAEVQIFAPDVPQMHVIDHTKGQPSESETRNVLTESARIARGKITDLARLSAADHDAAIFPGGFGAAKNLSTFAVDGKDCRVHKDVERVLKEFHEAGKPIGIPPTWGLYRPRRRTSWVLWKMSQRRGLCGNTAAQRACAASLPFSQPKCSAASRSPWATSRRKAASGPTRGPQRPSKPWAPSTV